jgi:(p)ppGpp synthase/HD superfamily hydrolase
MAPAPDAQPWARLVAAAELAAAWHGAQRRKVGGVPYVGHLLGVAGLVLDDGGDEDQAVAALLHDAAEDQGGRATLDEIRARFGERVAAIVEACTDTFDTPKPPWRPRKEAWLARLATVPDDAVRVVLADKLHNARSVVAELRTHGAGVLDAFRGGRGGTPWYYRRVVEELGPRAPGPLVDELRRTVAEMELLASDRHEPDGASGRH